MALIHQPISELFKKLTLFISPLLSPTRPLVVELALMPWYLGALLRLAVHCSRPLCLSLAELIGASPQESIVCPW